ncbi:MAG: hypothetical protein IPL46_06385 [Saprospiraceae bacterium]|nr:hypothetical protein [Saprospiraceae bacterium]
MNSSWKYLIGIIGCFLTMGNDVLAQFSLSGQFRPRFEFRNGYRTPAGNTLQAAAFVSQRTRLILDYKKSKIMTKLSLQDVRVWGDEPQLSNISNMALHEAWAELALNDHWGIKLGDRSGYTMITGYLAMSSGDSKPGVMMGCC